MDEKIFVSYAHEDRDLVEAVEQALRKHGILTEKNVIIMDPQRDIPAGENIRKMIKDQISAASKVVIIDSKNSAESQWVNYEAGMAAALGKPIFLIRRKGVGKTALASALGNVRSIEFEKKG